MRDVITLPVIALVIGIEIFVWVRNPMHVPSAFLPARAFGLQVFQELGPSMEPAVSSGHHLLVSSWSYWKGDPQVGDVIAFAYPLDPSVADLKRIVATPGATVEIRDGVTLVDGRPAGLTNPTVRSMPRMQIPAGRYFVLGDNASQSEDSRSYGLIARASIIGKRWW